MISDINTVKELKNIYDYNQYGVLDRSIGKSIADMHICTITAIVYVL